MLFAGDTFNPLFLGLFMALLCLFRWKVTAFREWLDAGSNTTTRWSWVHLGVTFGFAGLLSAVQVLPTQELLALSVRKVPLKLKEVSYHAWKGAITHKGGNEVKSFYARSLERTGDKRHARLNTQRKILEVLWTLWRRGLAYDAQRFAAASPPLKNITPKDALTTATTTPAAA